MEGLEITVTPATYTDMAGNKPKDNLFVYFHEVIEEDIGASQKAGRPVAKSVIYLCKQVPGQTDTIDRPMKEKDKYEFPKQWGEYEAKRTQSIVGTALEQWPVMSRTRVFEMKAMGVHTVEQIVSLPDSVAHRIMDFQKIKRQAEEFLELSRKPQLFAEAKEEVARKDAQLKDALTAIEELKSQVAMLAANQKKAPGRKPKLVTGEHGG